MTRATLTLLRHAKSSWKNQHQSDHERPLNNRGNRDAPDMAARLVQRDSIPSLILCSSAQRTRDTAAHLLEVFGEPSPDIHYVDALYLASPGTMLELLEQVADNIDHVMVIAHNPGIEDLSAELQGGLPDIMPTAAIRQFSCHSINGLRQQLRASGKQDHEASKDNAQAIELVYTDYPKSTAT